MSQYAYPILLGDNASTAKQWHPFYIDPADDLVIVSNDGVHFRVSSYRLIRASTVFRDLLGNSAGQVHSDASTKPIELDYPAITIEQFLRQIYAPRAHESLGIPRAGLFDTPDNNYTIQSSLYRLYCHLDCQTIRDERRSHTASSTRSSKEAFDLLVIASDLDDIRLGGEAVNRVNDRELLDLWGSSDVAQTQLSRLQPRWAAIFHQQLLFAANTDPRSDGFGLWQLRRGRYFEQDVSRHHRPSYLPPGTAPSEIGSQPLSHRGPSSFGPNLFTPNTANRPDTGAPLHSRGPLIQSTTGGLPGYSGPTYLSLVPVHLVNNNRMVAAWIAVQRNGTSNDHPTQASDGGTTMDVDPTNLEAAQHETRDQEGEEPSKTSEAGGARSIGNARRSSM